MEMLNMRARDKGKCTFVAMKVFETVEGKTITKSLNSK